jgi:hypothetical protein
MSSHHARTGPRHQPERVHERAADPAEAVNRPLEPKTPAADPDRGTQSEDPHHQLNTPVGEPSPEADSDPYRPSTPDDEADHASGTSGANQGAER